MGGNEHDVIENAFFSGLINSQKEKDWAALTF